MTSPAKRRFQSIGCALKLDFHIVFELAQHSWSHSLQLLHLCYIVDNINQKSHCPTSNHVLDHSAFGLIAYQHNKTLCEMRIHHQHSSWNGFTRRTNLMRITLFGWFHDDKTGGKSQALGQWCGWFRSNFFSLLTQTKTFETSSMRHTNQT